LFLTIATQYAKNDNKVDFNSEIDTPSTLNRNVNLLNPDA